MQRLWAWLKSFSAVPRKRLIFRYWDGETERCADPIAVWRALEECTDFSLDSDPPLAFPREGDGDSDATRRLIAAVQAAFRVQAFLDCGLGRTQGLTELECLSLFLEFDRYVGALKKNTSPSPTPPEHSPERSGSTGRKTTTSVSSDCG